MYSQDVYYPTADYLGGIAASDLIGIIRLGGTLALPFRNVGQNDYWEGEAPAEPVGLIEH